MLKFKKKMAKDGIENPSFIGDNHGEIDEIELEEQLAVKKDAKEGNEDFQDNGETLDDCNCFGNSLGFLNCFRTPKWLLVFLSIGALIQGMVVNGFVNVVLTSIERRFGLQSSQSGLIASSYDIAALSVSIPVAYLGGRIGASKPRWIASGLFLLGIGSFVFSLPHFMTGTYTYSKINNGTSNQDPLCGSTTEATDNPCLAEDGEETSGLARYRYLFILGQLLHGFGSTPLLVLGTTLINESVSKKVAPLYLAIFQTCMVIGPALGYILGGGLLKVFVDTVPSLDITPESVIWVGAWWPGFLLASGFSIVLTLPMFCFPANLNKEISKKDQKNEDILLKKFLRQLYRLVTNPMYVLLSLGEGIDDITLLGMAAFLSKYMEHQYRITIGSASQLGGLILVVAGGGGTFLGGWITKKLELKRTSIILMCCLFAIAGLFTSSLFLLGCSAPLYSGVNYLPIESPSNVFTLPNSSLTLISQLTGEQQCNRHCSCPVESFSPVCGSDNIMHLSPCMAGCENQNGGNYSGCSCVGNAGTASKTICSSDCTYSYFVPFLIICFLYLFSKFMASTPTVVIVLRSVRPEDQDLAIGLLNMVGKLMGSIPGPLLFGYVFDQACELWEQDCGEKGSCLLYDHEKLSFALLGTMIITKMIYLLCLSASAWISYRDLEDTSIHIVTVKERINEESYNTRL